MKVIITLIVIFAASEQRPLFLDVVDYEVTPKIYLPSNVTFATKPTDSMHENSQTKNKTTPLVETDVTTQTTVAVLTNPETTLPLSSSTLFVDDNTTMITTFNCSGVDNHTCDNSWDRGFEMASKSDNTTGLPDFLAALIAWISNQLTTPAAWIAAACVGRC